MTAWRPIWSYGGNGGSGWAVHDNTANKRPASQQDKTPSTKHNKIKITNILDLIKLSKKNEQKEPKRRN
jgi:hypothetical protein